MNAEDTKKGRPHGKKAAGGKRGRTPGWKPMPLVFVTGWTVNRDRSTSPRRYAWYLRGDLALKGIVPYHGDLVKVSRKKVHKDGNWTNTEQLAVVDKVTWTQGSYKAFKEALRNDPGMHPRAHVREIVMRGRAARAAGQTYVGDGSDVPYPGMDAPGKQDGGQKGRKPTGN